MRLKTIARKRGRYVCMWYIVCRLMVKCLMFLKRGTESVWGFRIVVFKRYLILVKKDSFCIKGKIGLTFLYSVILKYVYSSFVNSVLLVFYILDLNYAYIYLFFFLYLLIVQILSSWNFSIFSWPAIKICC